MRTWSLVVFMMFAFLLGGVVRIGRGASGVRTCSSSSVRGRPVGGICMAADRSSSSEPIWRIETEYPSLESVELRSDIDKVADLVKEIKALEKKFEDRVVNAEEGSLEDYQRDGVIEALAKTADLRWEAETLLSNVGVFASCEKSVNGRNEQARKISIETQQMSANLRESLLSKDMFLMRCNDDVVQAFLNTSDRAKAEEAMLARARKLRDTRLSLSEEKLLTSLSVHGHSSWGGMYSTLASTTKCTLTLKDGTSTTVGLATAAAMLDSTSEDVRKAAWECIRNGWSTHEEACAAALNSMVGWRLEVYGRRKMHFLDVPLHQNHMTRKTLETMLRVVEERSELARGVLRTKARLLGKEKLDAWDLFAPPPPEIGDDGSDLRYSYTDAIALIREAVGSIHPSMGDFVQMMADNEWIEGRTADAKTPGAYMTSFAKSRTPRVYLSNFNGGATHVLTLAHELGHAFHDWVMRDLPLAETSIGMNVAETASIFFETVVTGALLDRAESSSERLRLLWAATGSATAFLLNIPARYRFEEQLHIERAKQSLSPGDLSAMMEKAWKDQYGDSLTTVEPHFWQSKLHFYITGVCFYNFPYTFGWLLALGVYGQKDTLGKDFYTAYVDLLRDTGRLDAEELVSRHMKEDISEEAFWHKSLDMVKKQCALFDEEAANVMPIKVSGPVYQV